MQPRPMQLTSSGPILRVCMPMFPIKSGCSPYGLLAISYKIDSFCLLELLFELVQHPVARQHLGDAAVGFAPFADRGEELAVLQLNAVHADVDLGDVDLLVLAVEQVIVARDVGRAEIGRASCR